MGKYEPLRRFLERQGASEVRMTFSEIEAVVGFALPAKSKSDRPWWSNNPNNNVMTKEWLAAGYRTEQVNIEQGKLVFRKRESPVHGGKVAAPPQMAVEESEDGRDPLFGCMKEVTWIAPGVDLTEPADPEWADLIEDPDWHP